MTITADGWLTDVDLGDPDGRGHLRRLVGCAAVPAVALSADLLMWVADAADGSPLNAAATDLVMTAYGIPNQTIDGTVVLTGGTVDGSDIHRSLEAGRSFIARHQAVRPVDTATPNS